MKKDTPLVRQGDENPGVWVFVALMVALILFYLFSVANEVSDKTSKPKVDLSHPKVLEYRLVVKASGESEYFALAIHHSVPNVVLKAVLEASTAHQALRASKDYPVIVKLGETPQEALNDVTYSIVNSPVLQTTH